MDPASVLSIVNASLGLALKCGKVAADLNTLASRLKQAEISVLEIVNDCRMIETVLKRIESMTKLSEGCIDEDIYHQLASTLKLGSMVIVALENDLASVMNMKRDPGFREKMKIMWNGGVIKIHQDRITRQLTAMTCLLKLMELSVFPPGVSREVVTNRSHSPRPSLSIQRETLLEKTEIFRKAESSAWTIVNSRASTSINDKDSLTSAESAELEYKQLSFEDQLFTATVYKRNFRPKTMAKLPKAAVMDSPSRAIQPHESALDDQQSTILNMQQTKETPFADTQPNNVNPQIPSPEPLPPLMCIKCGEHQSQQVTLLRHIRTVHSHQMMKCKECDATFFSVHGFVDHLTRKHMGGVARFLEEEMPPWTYTNSDSPERNQAKLEELSQRLTDRDYDAKVTSIGLPNLSYFLRHFLGDANASVDPSVDFRAVCSFMSHDGLLWQISHLLCECTPFPSGFLISLAISKKTTFFDILDYWSEFTKNSQTPDGDTLTIGYPGVEEAMVKLKQDCLVLAILKGDLFLAEGLLMRSTDAHGFSDAKNANRKRPIDIALDRGNIALCRLLMRYGVCLEHMIPSTQGLRYPIFHAIAKNQPDMVEFLLGEGQSVHSRDEQGYQPLHRACHGGYFEIAQQLVQAGASVTSATMNEGFHPLHCVIHGDLDNENGKVLLEYLVDNGADLNAVDLYTKRTPLLMACDLRRITLERFLVNLSG